MENIKLGDRVKILGKNANGEIAFIGKTHFAEGSWFGVILDEAKGKNNGSVDGTRYFKCPRKHGVFVKACQIKKENMDNILNSVSTKITYPNYLKASSKLKKKSQLKSVNEHIEDDHTEDHKSANKNLSELLTIKQENKEFKNKLKSAEESFKEIQLKYTKAVDEIQHLKNGLACKKKEIKVLKCHLKLLKMRHCNHYKKTVSFKATAKNSDQSFKDDCLLGQASLLNDESSHSDDEFDLESMKALTSMQRMIDLEEQNRIMVEGLVELREFLNTTVKSSKMNIYNPDSKILKQSKGEIGNTNYLPFSKDSSLVMPGKKFSHEETASHLKEYRDILKEMKIFSDMVNERVTLKKDLEEQNMINASSATDCEPTEIEQMSQNKNKMLQSNCHLSDIIPKDKSDLEIENNQEASGRSQNLQLSNASNLQNNIRTHDIQKSIQSKPKSKDNSQLNCMNNGMPQKASDPVEDWKHLWSTMLRNSEDVPCRGTPSFVDNVRKSASNSILGKSESQLEFQLALQDHSLNLAVNSSGDGALILPKKEASKIRALLSTQLYQRQEGDK